MAVDRVEFVWRANFRAAPLVSLRVRDWYRAGAGGLDGRLWGVFPIVHAGGETVARGEAMRYLAELAWAPQVIVTNPALECRAVDDSTVEVATLVGRERVAVLLHFDRACDIVAASAEARPRMVGKQAVATPFRGVYGEYREFAGVRLPTTAEVSWLLPEGPFTYFRGDRHRLDDQQHRAPLLTEKPAMMTNSHLNDPTRAASAIYRGRNVRSPA